MKTCIFASALALATSVAAAPQGLPTIGCLTQATANQLLDRFTAAFQHQNSDLGTPTETLDAILASNFEEVSDSILALEDRLSALGQPSTTSKANYISGLLGGPPVSGITTYLVAPVGCSQMIWQWKFTGVGTQEYEVKGFNLFDLNFEQEITTLYVEFNSIAWGLDTGYSITYPATIVNGKN